ncbi:radical SAM protein [Peredibacter sp. HCB2-198]|uniref:radical SAM protein n=1 Tax=Peredibacter sp. HCB2-198 TaxID=3383025 RepID=UPI0038B684E0
MKQEEIVSVGSGSPININWELVSHCQFNCSYCYYKPYKSETDYKPLAKIVLKRLSKITDSTKVTLLGGEPTLHPSFHEVIHSLYEMAHVKQICIVTNFEKPLKFWQDLLPFKSKLKIVVSFHPEYEQKNMFQKIRDLQSDFLLDFVFIVHNEEQYLPKMEMAAKELDNLDFGISLNFVKLHEKGLYRKYPKTISDFMISQQEKVRNRPVTETVNIVTKAGPTKIPKFEMINHGLNQFEGWSCKLRAFIIKEDGQVASACTNKTKHILVADFSETILKCTYKICECDDYWEFTKTRS